MSNFEGISPLILCTYSLISNVPIYIHEYIHLIICISKRGVKGNCRSIIGYKVCYFNAISGLVMSNFVGIIPLFSI